MEEYFSGSFNNLFRYWQDPERAKKFQNGGTRTKAVRYLLDRAEVEVHKGIWVDTAIGAGYVQSLLYKSVLPALMVGIDFSRKMLELVDEGVERILGSAFKLPIRSTAVNIATNIFCLSDYPDPSGALEELARITKISGIVMLLDYSDQDEYWILRQQQHDPDRLIGNIHLRNPESILSYLPHFHIVQNIILEYKVSSKDFDTRLELPETINRAFLFVELYHPRSSEN